MHPMGHCTICNRGRRDPRSQPYAPGDSVGDLEGPQPLRVEGLTVWRIHSISKLTLLAWEWADNSESPILNCFHHDLQNPSLQ